MKRGVVTGLLCILSAAGGAVCGYLVAGKTLNKFYEKKYRKIADEEVASTKEALSKWYEKNWEEKKSQSEDSRNKSSDILNKYNTASNEAVEEEDISDTQRDLDMAMEETHPEVTSIFDIVSDVEVAENREGYEVEDLVYYGGTNLRTESTDELVDIDETIGRDSLNYIGEYKASMLFVRNNQLRTYYEVFVDDSDYLRIKNEGKKPRDSYNY